MWKPSNRLGLIALVPCTCAALIALLGLWLHPESIMGGAGTYMLELLSNRLTSILAGPATAVSWEAGSEWRRLFCAIFNASLAVGYALFGLLFYLACDPRRDQRDGAMGRMLGAQVALAVFAPYQLVYFVTLEAGYLLPLRQARRWLLLTEAAVPATCMLALAALHRTGEPLPLLSGFLLRAILQAAAFGFGYMLAREKRGREAVARAHQELQATQQMLADVVRNSERARMARGLHDAIGHHLTALHLHLDLARRQVAAPVPALDVARKMAATLLAEIRAVIGAERARLGLDLEPALRTLCDGIPSPRVELAFSAPAFDAPLVAEAVFRVVQEGLTNAMRHAQAGTVRVRVVRERTCLVVSVEDDGAARRYAEPGNGLRGLREQVEAAGGYLEAGPHEERGFRLCASMPMETLL